VAQPFAYDLRVDALAEHQRGVGVTEVVDPQARQTRGTRDARPLPQEVPRLDRRADARRKDEVMVALGRAGDEPGLGLAGDADGASRRVGESAPERRKSRVFGCRKTLPWPLMRCAVCWAWSAPLSNSVVVTPDIDLVSTSRRRDAHGQRRRQHDRQASRRQRDGQHVPIYLTANATAIVRVPWHVFG
jgi:hypothetical protein